MCSLSLSLYLSIYLSISLSLSLCVYSGVEAIRLNLDGEALLLQQGHERDALGAPGPDE